MSVAVVPFCKSCGASRLQVPFDLYRTAHCAGCAKAMKAKAERERRSKQPKRPRPISALRAARNSGNVPPPEETLSIAFLSGDARVRKLNADRDYAAMERWALRGCVSG